MKKNHKIFIICCLLVIFCYGFFLRFYKINEQSYWIDEGYTLNAVLSTLEKDYPILDSGEIYGRNYLLNTYLIATMIKINGLNPISTRLPAVLFGSGMILLIFFFVKKHFNFLIGFGAAFLTAFSYWEIAWSRQARMYIQLQFFFFLSLYLFYSLLDKFSYKKLIFLILSTLATIYSHYFGYFLLLIYAPILLIYFIKLEREKKKYFLKNKKLIAMGIFFIFLASFSLIKPAGIFFTQLNNQFFPEALSYQKFLWKNLPLIIISAFLGVLIAIFKEKKIEKSFGLILAYLIPYLFIIFSADSQHFRYLFFIMPILFVFSAYFIDFVGKKFKLSLFFLVFLFSCLIVGSNFLNKDTFIFKARSHYYLESHTPQPDFKSAYEAILKEAWNDDKIIISPFTQLDKIYLGRSDYWLAIDLHGRPLDATKLKEREYYNNALTISSKDQLAKIIDSFSGYLIIDSMAKTRLNKEINDLIVRQKLIFTNQTKLGDHIWVFSF